MKFERTQTQSHKVANSTLHVFYDRLSTKFVLKENDKPIYSAFLGLLPIRKSVILINGEFYTIKIFWLLLWQSKIVRKNDVIINELLNRRRRQSIVLLIYMALITGMKIGVFLFLKPIQISGRLQVVFLNFLIEVFFRPSLVAKGAWDESG